MWWLVVLIPILIALLALLGGMGFFSIDPGDTDARNTRRGVGNNYIDWML